MGSFSIGHWLILLAVVVMIFGTRRLRGAGSDISDAIRNFKDAIKEGEGEAVKIAEPLARDGKASSKGDLYTHSQNGL